MDNDSNWFVAFLIIAAIAIAANALTIIQLFRVGSLTAITTRLILYLHVSAFIQNIAALPLVYNENDGLCDFMAFMHYYGGLANIVTLTLLTAVYRNFTLDAVERNSFIRDYAFHMSFLIPLVTLLPFTTSSYSSDGVFCTLNINNETADGWSFAIFYIWLTIALVYCSIVFGYAVYHSWHEKGVGQALFSTAGVYIVISWFALMPRLIPRLIALFKHITLSDADQFFQDIPADFATLLYCVCFAYNYKAFKKFEKQSSRARSMESSMHISIADLEHALTDIKYNDSTTDRSSALSNGRGSSFTHKKNPLHEKNQNGEKDNRISEVSVESVENGKKAVNSSNNNPAGRPSGGQSVIKAFLERNSKHRKSQPNNNSITQPNANNVRESEMSAVGIDRESSTYTKENPLLKTDRNSTNSVIEVDRNSSFDESKK
jgi:hypothetical protein